MIGYIYKFTNPLNNKVYIGQTVNLHRRFTKHRYDTPKCHTKFGEAIKKFGKCCRGVIKTSGGFIWKFKTI